MPHESVQHKSLRLFLEHHRLRDLKQYLKAAGPADAVVYKDLRTGDRYVTKSAYRGSETLEEVSHT